MIEGICCFRAGAKCDKILCREPINDKDVKKEVAKTLIPAFVSTGVTCGLSFASGRYAVRTINGLTALLATSAGRLTDIRAKEPEAYNNTVATVTDDLSGTPVVTVDEDGEIYYDCCFKIFMRVKDETISKALVQTNEMIQWTGAASVFDFYKFMHYPERQMIEHFDLIGWNKDVMTQISMDKYQIDYCMLNLEDMSHYDDVNGEVAGYKRFDYNFEPLPLYEDKDIWP